MNRYFLGYGFVFWHVLILYSNSIIQIAAEH